MKEVIITYRNGTIATFTHSKSVFKDRVFILTLQEQENEIEKMEIKEK